ncbi:hypothetical protein DL771_002352 [Monosporascus sp. 5C6A]|nr:hypothetical protein DL771_002352 [Monosporascus sp. 5C6A]
MTGSNAPNSYSSRLCRPETLFAAPASSAICRSWAPGSITVRLESSWFSIRQVTGTAGYDGSAVIHKLNSRHLMTSSRLKGGLMFVRAHEAPFDKCVYLEIAQEQQLN